MTAKDIVIAGTGLYTPSQGITNEELVNTFNQYVDQFNEKNKQAIEAGGVDALQHSSVEFIEKASGIKHRYVLDKEGLLDPKVMHPLLTDRSDDEPSWQCEMAVAAAEEALAQSGLTVDDIDVVIAACSNFQRSYPAIAVEVQTALGIDGYAYDMNVACSSATFGIQAAINAIHAGEAKTVLVVNPEICSGHLAWEDRDCHFIFGDVCTATILQATDQAFPGQWRVLGTKLWTQFSNNIRNNRGFLNRCDPVNESARDKLFYQNGRKVFKEVCPQVAKHLVSHAEQLDIDIKALNCLWLHQANINMNHLIVSKVLGREPDINEAPVILDQYANTSSAGSLVAFHLHRDHLKPGDRGVLCSFGAGYSIGSVFLECV